MALACGAAVAGAQVEPILYTNGPIPGVTGATIWQTGLYRPAFSPNKQTWAIRVNRSSASDDEYLVVGSGVTGTVAIHGNGTAAANPPGIPTVFYLAERGYRINDSGQIAFSGHNSLRAQTNTLWRYTPGASPLIETVAQENNPAFFTRPDSFGPNFVELTAPAIANSGSVVFAESDARVEASDRDVIFRWDGTQNSYVELLAEGQGFTNPDLADRTLDGLNTGEANMVNWALFYFQNDSADQPIFGFYGDTTGPTTEDNALVRVGPTGDLTAVYREGTTIDGVFVASPNPTLVGWIDAAGNEYATSGGAFGPVNDAFAFINGVKVAKAGEPVGGTVPGELWSTANTTILTSSISSLDTNAIGGYVIGGGTNNADPARGQVVIYVAPDGTRTEILRTGVSTVEVDVAGVAQVRTITTLSQQDASFSGVLTDTHFYFLAGTTPVAGTIPADLFARIPLPPSGPACPACAADFDQDGGVTGADVEAFFLAFELGDPCGDTDADGGVTGADVEAFFIAFEAGGC
jgi:hypothetical protein